ncbi:MAG: hypothetical protein RL885_17885 [Planctomycetota bacterium]
MKDQYFGDINDYRKYGLLRTIASAVDGPLLVGWMLTPDDGTTDGGRRAYLDRPQVRRHFDPVLFDGLAKLLREAPRPSVRLIESSGLLPRARFHSEIVPDSKREREHWTAGLLTAARGADLVFVDPDNGIEVPSAPIGRKGSSKYVTWDELQSLWQLGSSLLIYQHFPRRPREAFARELVHQLRERTGAKLIEAFHTSHVLFLLAAQPRHETNLHAACETLTSRWHGEISPIGFRGPRPPMLGLV